MTDAADLNAELRGPLLVLLIVVPVLALAGWWSHVTLGDAAAFQNDVRVAQVARARVLRLQLDEETGLRGYLASGDKLYLEPFDKAVAAMPAATVQLQHAVAVLDAPTADPIPRRETRINQGWLDNIARPLLPLAPRSAQALELQKRGKQHVDDFRNLDQQLQTMLDDLAKDSAQRTNAALTLTSLLTVLALILVAASAGVFGFLQARAARRAFEARLLYENQKHIADELQTAFLVKDLPSSPSIGLHATYVPATAGAKVGGDWYDAFELPDKRILFSIGDVEGHGLGAAITMSRVRQSIVAAALHENDPARVLERANASMLLQGTSSMATSICGFIDPHTAEVIYATAGHPPPVLAAPGQAPAFLPQGGVPLGVLEDVKYRTFVTHAVDGALFVLYTDGVTEHGRDILAGEARLLDAVGKAMGAENPALAIQRHVFSKSAAVDDVAILTVSFVRLSGSETNIRAIDALQASRFEPPHPPAESSGASERVGSAPQTPSQIPDDMDRALRVLLASHPHVSP
jgi:serine phosphatase RsbU (regulator of sigma subunit)